MFSHDNFSLQSPLNSPFRFFKDNDSAFNEADLNSAFNMAPLSPCKHNQRHFKNMFSFENEKIIEDENDLPEVSGGDKKTTFKIKVIPLKIHGRNRIHKIQIRYMTKLVEAIEKLLKEDKEGIEEDQLTFCQFKLLKIFFTKKFNKTCRNSIIKKQIQNAETLEEVYNFIQLTGSTKRTEENRKFIYKHTLSFLKAKFYKENDLAFNRESEDQFYQSYFEELSKETGEPLFAFYNPLSLRNKQKGKTITNGHLSLLFACEKFRKDFFDYLNNGFKEDYQSSVYKKLETIFLELERKIEDTELHDRQKTIKSFINNFEERKRVKFPWSGREIDLALTQFKRQIDKICRKKQQERN